MDGWMCNRRKSLRAVRVNHTPWPQEAGGRILLGVCRIGQVTFGAVTRVGVRFRGVTVTDLGQ